MSTEAFARAVRRESIIWPQFTYSTVYSAGQTAERKIIYGLYANAYLNAHGYLTDIEADELANLLNDYNTKMAGLTAKQQALAIDIAAKRYVATIEQNIHADKLATKQKDIDMDAEIMTAKEDALAADQAALETLYAKLLAEQKKTEARIQVLQAEAAEEDVRYEMVGIEISEKEIQLAETELKIQNVAIEIARIQLRITEAASEIVEIELRAAELKNRTVNAEIDAIRAGLTGLEVSLVNAETTMEAKLLLIQQQEKTLWEDKKTMLENTVQPIYQEISAALPQIILDKATAQKARNKNELAKMDYDLDMAELRNDERKDAVELEGIGIDADNSVRDNQTTVIENRDNNEKDIAYSIAQAAIDAATAMAKAEITTKLTHIIGKA